MNSSGEYKSNSIKAVESMDSLINSTAGMLTETRSSVSGSGSTLSVPITELASLGAAVSSLLPAINTISQTTAGTTGGLYQLANAEVGDVLKQAKDGNFWGAFKTADGSSKFAQLKEVDASSIEHAKSAINPATMMMAVALFSIEKDLGNIADMEKQILSFLEIENEAQIEADVETLMGIVRKYKSNWDNEHFVASNHKQALDIQRTARTKMIAFQKKIDDVLKSKMFIVGQGKVKSTVADLQKKFQYYRLSLYTFSMASLMEVMLSGNFKEEYISGIRDEIKSMSEKYRELFGECSLLLEKMGNSAVEANVLNGIGAAGKGVGKFIGNIPKAKDGRVGKFFQGSGEDLKKNAADMKKKAVEEFAVVSNPDTNVLIEKLDDMIQIYNHTSQICFDKERIYLVSNKTA